MLFLFVFALHVAVVITSCTETLLFSVFPFTQHEKSAYQGGRKDDAFGNRKLRQHARVPRDIPHVRPSRMDSEERRRATPNSQSTGRIDIVPREWASGTKLAISRLGNCFAASNRTAREVNDTRLRNVQPNIIS